MQFEKVKRDLLLENLPMTWIMVLTCICQGKPYYTGMVASEYHPIEELE